MTMVLIIISCVSFSGAFLSSAINIALPDIGREFHLNAIMLNWVATSFILTSAVFLVPFGRMSDIWGRKRMFVAGIWLYSLAALVSALARSAALLFCGRILQGIGAAMTFGTGMAILTATFPIGKRGKALGINVAATYCGLSTGPFLGGLIVHAWGWRALFWSIIPLGLLMIAFSFFYLREQGSETRAERMDWPGSFVYGGSLTAIMLGFSLLPRLSGPALIILGIVGLLFFLRYQEKIAQPLIAVHLFRQNTVFAFSNLAALVNYSATAAITFLLSLYLQYIHGLPPHRAGLVLVAQPLVMAAFSPLAGWLSDRHEPQLVASLGMGLTTMGLFFFALLGPHTPLPAIVANLLLLGFGFALFSSPNTNAIVSSVEKKHHGFAAGTVGTMRLIGQMLSMGLTMMVFALLIGRVQIGPQHNAAFLRSLHWAFALFSVLSLGGIFASLARGKLR